MSCLKCLTPLDVKFHWAHCVTGNSNWMDTGIHLTRELASSIVLTQCWNWELALAKIWVNHAWKILPIHFCVISDWSNFHELFHVLCSIDTCLLILHKLMVCTETDQWKYCYFLSNKNGQNTYFAKWSFLMAWKLCKHTIKHQKSKNVYSVILQ